MAAGDHGWPRLEWEQQYWRGDFYAAAVPPRVQSLDPTVEQEVALLAREAELELARLDGELKAHERAYARIVACCEAVASSDIEGVRATAFDVLVADQNPADAAEAAAVAANMRATRSAIDFTGWMSPDLFRSVHGRLMEGRPQYLPGEYRREPVWIRPSVESPIRAQFHAPHHTRLPELMEDLAAYCRRYDVSPLTHIATAHAQLETLHPFTYGNGRTGRAIALTMLRQRGVTRDVPPPLSIGLRADMENYYRALSAYREGEITPIVAQFSMAGLRTVANVRRFVSEMETVRLRCGEAARARAGSIKERLLESALGRPVFAAEAKARELGIERTNVYRYLDQLQRAGVLATARSSAGAELWYLPEVFSAMHRFLTRFGRRR